MGRELSKTQRVRHRTELVDFLVSVTILQERLEDIGLLRAENMEAAHRMGRVAEMLAISDREMGIRRAVFQKRKQWTTPEGGGS